MAKFFGVSNHSPDQVIKFLERRTSASDILGDLAILPFGKKLSPTKKSSRSILFVISISDFYRNAEVLNSPKYANKQVFVFSSPLRLNELTGIIRLDFEHDPALKGLGFLLKSSLDVTAYRNGLRKDADKPIVRNTGRYLTHLIDSIKQGSLLTPLMTFIYTLPSSTLQTPVKNAVVDFFYKGQSIDKLLSVVKDIPAKSISERSLQALEAVLRSEIADNFKAAFKEFRALKKEGKPTVIPAICKRHGISDYEFKYLKSIVDDRDAVKLANSKR